MRTARMRIQKAAATQYSDRSDLRMRDDSTCVNVKARGVNIREIVLHEMIFHLQIEIDR